MTRIDTAADAFPRGDTVRTRTTLRPYQVDILRSVDSSDERRVLVVLPTGGGKTAIAEALADAELERGGRVVFLVDRQELAAQAQARLGGGRLMGRHSAGDADRIVTAGVATLARRNTRPDATLVIVDEAHCYLAESYRRVVEAYRDSGARVIGLTATPARLDGQGLGELFDAIVQGPSMQELIDDGYLVPVRTYAPTGPWWEKVGVRAGDFRPDELGDAANAVLRDVVGAWSTAGGKGRLTLAFACTKRHAADLAARWERDADVIAEVVTDDTPAAERAALKRRLAAGSTDVVVNVGILGVGWDFPAVSCIVMARPTLSWGLYLQQAGRGTRPAPGKRDLLLVDCAGNALRHGLVTKPFPVSLGGLARKHRRAVAGLSTCPRCFRVYEPTEPSCPSCGAARAHTERKLRTVDGQLVEMTGAEVFAERATETQQVRLLARWTREATERGWKPSAPMARFRGMFRRWPSGQEIHAARQIAGGAS